ncbi:hypothetical protein H8L32_06440 [Undibacterium sp. CY18W]|uniref:Protein CopB n=1 Tax=Undibacterium hunanense TaxID=2762292 RepID=A0ABR6ZMJ4_9BURK|nr:hypothetical protein [Undibacterium hunanense]MBC3917107.1 hypothetical protein [Undibacterium hunanense]
MPRAKQYENDAERVKAFRERKNLKTLCVQIPADLHQQFEEFLKFKNVTKSQIIEKLIRSQLLRKR